MTELKTEKQNRVSANEKAQKNASEVEQQNEIYRDKILELEDEKYKLQEQVEGIKNAIHFQASDLEKVKSEGIQYIKGSFKSSFEGPSEMYARELAPYSPKFHPCFIRFPFERHRLVKMIFELEKNLIFGKLLWTNV